MRRLFWLSVGAAAGYYAARRSAGVVDEARQRGLVGSVTLAASTATKAAGTASRMTFAVGESVGQQARGRVRGAAASAPSATPVPPPTAATLAPEQTRT